MSILITEHPFDPEAAHKEFRESVGDAGALVAFTGLVRGGGDVTSLTLHHYPGFTEDEIARIAQTADEKWPLIGLMIIHRVGEMKPDEPIVFVATASAHRRDAFEAADFLMDYLKSEAPFWKQETKTNETRWIEPREEDITDKQRWDDHGRN